MEGSADKSRYGEREQEIIRIRLEEAERGAPTKGRKKKKKKINIYQTQARH